MLYNIIANSLEFIGLNEFQILLYFEIRSDYDQTLTQIARQLNVQRLKIYNNIMILEKMELITITKRSKNLILNTTKVQSIKKIVEQKQFEAKQMLEGLERLIKIRESQDEYKVTQYKGRDQFLFGLFRILELAETGSQIFHFGDNNKVFELMGEAKAQEWINKRIAKKIITNDILPNNFTNQFLDQNSESELRRIKFLPKDKIVKSSYLLFNNSVAIWNANELKLEIIEDNDMYKTFKTNFDLLWESLD
jgi:DNA-binding MarR family transcriptional regulator